MGRVLRVVGLLVALQVVVYGTGQALKLVLRRTAPGKPDPLANTFDLINVMETTQFASRSGGLLDVVVKNYLGAVKLDLREARLTPGAVLEVETIMGSTEVIVPRGWRVILRGDAIAAAHELDVTPEDDLNLDSPTLTIEARTILGAVEVRAVAPARMVV